MTTKEAQFQDYVLPVARKPKVWIDNLIYDELGQAVLAELNSRFRGVKDIEDLTEYQEGQPLSFSNTPRALAYNQELRKLTNGGIRVLSPTEVVRYWDSIPDKKGTYADTDAVSVYPNEGPNEDLRQIVLGILGIQRTDVPLLVSGLGVEKADNDYGFTFTETDFMEVLKAPFMTRDGKIRYDPETGKLVRSEDGVGIWTPSEQSGLRRAFRSGDVGLDVWYVWLLDSDADGRVSVIQDPQGRAEN